MKRKRDDLIGVPVVIVRCVECKATKKIRADNFPKHDVPFCDVCGGPMATVKAEVKLS